MSPDAAYYRAREDEERKLAAVDSSNANIHLNLAAKYGALAKEADKGPTLRSGRDRMSGAQSS